MERYPWHELVDRSVAHERLSERFSPPAGFVRVPAAPGSYAAFLRGLPVRGDRTDVRAYDGRALYQGQASPSAGLVLIDVGERDLQQCADAAIRLHAEYLWWRARKREIAYHFTSGDLVRWTDWQAGEVLRAVGPDLERSRGAARSGDYREFRRWLDVVFTYAGSRSLALDTEPVAMEALAPGDIYVQGGSPGHVVIVLDVATGPGGQRVALLGQSYMPAQDLHVLTDTHRRVLDKVWFLLPNAAHPQLSTPVWRPFAAGDARRFRIGQGDGAADGAKGE